MSDFCSQAAFARMIGKSKAYVTQLKQSGRLVMHGKKVDIEASLARMEETSDPARAKQPAHNQAQDEEKQAQADAALGTTYHQARAIKERFAALSAKLEYERAIAKLVDAEEVRQAGYALGVHLRTSMDNLRDRLAPELAHENDIDAIYAMLGEHFNNLLEDLHRSVANLAKAED